VRPGRPGPAGRRLLGDRRRVGAVTCGAQQAEAQDGQAADGVEQEVVTEASTTKTVAEG
jgi:hypothetical protein